VIFKRGDQVHIVSSGQDGKVTYVSPELVDVRTSDDHRSHQIEDVVLGYGWRKGVVIEDKESLESVTAPAIDLRLAVSNASRLNYNSWVNQSDWYAYGYTVPDSSSRILYASEPW